MKKTLGGDRLGSGSKMTVEMHNYERSTHDLGYVWRSTMAAGTLVPFMKQLALPGDTFDIHLNADVKTHPTVGPLFGSYKLQLDVFMAPIRLYNAKLHNNSINQGFNMSQVYLPYLELKAFQPNIGDLTDIDNCQINPSCLLSYLGIRGIGIPLDTDAVRNFNAVPFLAYWEIYKNYYANKQETNGVYIHTDYAAIASNISTIKIDGTTISHTSAGLKHLQNGSIIEITVTSATPRTEQLIFRLQNGGQVTLQTLGIFTQTATNIFQCIYNASPYGEFDVTQWIYATATDTINQVPTLAQFSLTNIDDARQYILTQWDDAVNIKDINKEPYTKILDTSNNPMPLVNTQEGLAIKTYQSDLLNNWVKTELYEYITANSAVDTSGGSFTIDQLNLANKVYNLLTRIAVSGGTYDDWLDAVFTHDRYQRCETPMYMGGLIKELVFQEVVSNAQTTEQPLGTLAGKGVMSNKHKGGVIVIKADEPCYIMGIVSLTPRIDYSQGNDWDTHLTTVDDVHKPALDQIGFQDLITEQMAWWDTHHDSGEWITKSAGKQPAWINYMTNINRTYGNFAINSNEMFMTLNRRYEADDNAAIVDLTTYIDPSKFNFIFAETRLDAQNFWTQIAVDITARRKMSAKIIPNL